MTPTEAQAHIRRFAGALLESRLAIDINWPVIQRDGPGVIVTWPTDKTVTPQLTDNPFGTIQESRQLILHRQYTCALIDGALLQMSVAFENAELTGTRFCYYPCPLTIEERWDPADRPLLDLFDDLLVEEFDGILDATNRDTTRDIVRLRMRGPIRFDYAPNQQAHRHPASHAHTCGDEIRIPVFGPLSIGHFVRFVIYHFYPSAWESSTLFSTWPLGTVNRSITRQEEANLFVECRANNLVGN